MYKYFILRLGNKFDPNESFTPSFGVGFSLQKKYNINYTYTSFSSDLGATHRIGFTFNFDTPATKRRSSAIQTSTALPLIPPKDLNARIDKDKVIVEWSALTGQGYNVYARFLTTGEWKKLNKSPIFDGQMKFKKPGTTGTYFFKVCSVSGTGQTESNFSGEVKINVE